MKAAIIDLGTNTFHLMIVKVEQGTFKILHKERIPVMIGKDGISRGIINQEAIERAIGTLCSFNNTIHSFDIDRTYVIGTSAIRNAVNKEQFISTVRQHTGLNINVIDGKYESELIYYGVRLAMDIREPALIMDIGGGSVEFIICDSEAILWKNSYEIGAQRLMDQFHHYDPITIEEIDRLNRFFADSLPSLAQAIAQYKPGVLIGSSGTFDTLIDIYRHKQTHEFDHSKIQIPLTVEGFYDIYDLLISKTRNERLQMPGMIEMRVDMIVVSSCLIKYIIEQFNFNDIRVSSFALKEGVLFQLIHREDLIKDNSLLI